MLMDCTRIIVLIHKPVNSMHLFSPKEVYSRAKLPATPGALHLQSRLPPAGHCLDPVNILQSSLLSECWTRPHLKYVPDW